jgi:ABC-2 type transport system permease protein
MAVYERRYRGYSGALTPAWSRFLVIPRYAFETLFQSKLVTAFFAGCFVWPLVSAILIYLHHNLSALKLLNLDAGQVIAINESFFIFFVTLQSWLAFLVTAFVGPNLVSTDLANNALPLYLCRPFSRTEYVVGKMSVLLILQSLITWIPGLLLFILQARLEGGGWLKDNLWMAGAVMLSSWVWILLLALMTLALSAWVKWRLAATALLFGVFFVAAGFGEAVNEVLRTKWGHLLNIGRLMGTIWADLFRVASRRTIWGELFGMNARDALPVWAAWSAVAVLFGICVLLLMTKIKAKEVVRS